MTYYIERINVMTTLIIAKLKIKQNCFVLIVVIALQGLKNANYLASCDLILCSSCLPV